MRSETIEDFKIKGVVVLTELTGRKHGQHIPIATSVLSLWLPQAIDWQYPLGGKKC